MRGLKLYAVLYLIFLYAPIFLLPLFAFNSSTVIAFPLQSFTTDWFTQLLTLREMHGALLNSLEIAVVSAVLATTLGIFAAMAATRYSFPGQKGIMGFIMLPLVLPEIIVAVSLLVVILRIGLDTGAWSVIAGHTLICTPFAIAILNSAFAALDPSLEEAAYDLGETPASTFRRVTLPLVMPGIISALLISFTISMDEFIIAFFLTGADPTLPVYLFSMMRFPKLLPAVMALGTILVVISVLLIVIAEYFRRRGATRAGLKDTGGFL
ncbi:ABC transporter permease [Celeribacter indicus]|uniref:Binding-protein-dependent transport system inner membrane protein n=1 Tax=Celeribacter indicus TaxID=1208324 RepID=A0A0B5E3C4_9RHOB|nr:ABC transporter permease [Celeribacter indicus]AJE46932.1 binding-protein-dependent transport system inner membrane protein [Celeribacter indicus]SDW78312.1 spermidine/putrescine transport system permease protein [Celeribacter indicus]